MPRAMPVVLSVYGGLGLRLALNPNPNPYQKPRAMPVVLSVYKGYQLLRRLCCTVVHETCTWKYVCFGLFFLLPKCCTAVVEMFYIFTNTIKTNSEVCICVLKSTS